MASVTMAATVPTQQYGNISPSFTVEGETHEQAMDLALKFIKDVWDRTAQKPLEVRDLDKYPTKLYGKELRCWASGTRVTFDPIEHSYETEGKRWLSGSTFAGNYKAEFNAPAAAARMAVKYGVDAGEILEMWALNAEASMTAGTAVHAALQLRGQYAQLSRNVKDGALDSALTKNPILRPIVEAFFEGREREDARYEVFVADPVRKHCGQIDRLVIEDDGLIVGDYKTNTDLLKAESIKAPFKGLVPNNVLGSYLLQLSFYARILQSHGRTVKAVHIYHWTNGEWVTHEYSPIDLDAAFDKAKEAK